MLEELYHEFSGSTGVCTDTRAITPGCLFFCLTGANFDGNKFADDALEKGASHAVIDNSEYSIPGKTTLVENTLVALQQLANYHRSRFSIPVLGITGSNGKTTSKELISTVLSSEFNVLFTNGNLNNHIGVPLTLLRLNPAHQVAVIEMGANKPGDIAELCDIAEPTHGIITNIGRAHLEGFGNLEGVAETKTALYRAIAKAAGDLFVNCEDETLLSRLPENVRCHTYGSDCEVSGRLVSLDPFVNMTWRESSYESPELHMKLVGKYNFTNYLAAIRIGRFFGISPERINRSLEDYTPSNNRSQITKTGRNTVIVDCYNANPTSMVSAIESFAAIDHPSKIFILGDMREMGSEADAVHREIIDLTKEKSLNGYFVGEEFSKLLGDSSNAYKTTDELIDALSNSPIHDSLVLLKGSRGIQLEKLLPLL